MSTLTALPLHQAFRDLSLMDYLGILWPERSQRALLDLFAAGKIRSGGKPAGARRLVGELADLFLLGAIEDVPTIFPELGDEPAKGLRVLYEDERLIALWKPSGVPVVPDRTKGLETVLGWLTRRELAARATKPPPAYLRLRIVHRIDRLTSGLVLVAKTAEAERKLAGDFEARRVKKEYLAILEGVVRPAIFTVHCPVVPGRKGKMRAEATGGSHDAITDFEVIRRNDATTLVRARPVTGRTHQIRVHAWAAGHPLAIDPLYGPKNSREIPGIDRLTLHAHCYTLAEDWEGKRHFEAEAPAAFLGGA